MADITPDLYSAIYKAQVSPVLGGTVNSSFTVDLESIVGWPSNDAAALLGMTSQLATNLDTAMSTFGYNVSNSDGSGVQKLDAVLGSIQVSAVPEPGASAMLLAGLALFIGRSASRRRG
jgi:hypothetical protein